MAVDDPPQTRALAPVSAADAEPAKVDPFALTPQELILLIRHRPVLMMDPQCDFTVLAADAATDGFGCALRRRRGETIAAAGGSPPLNLLTLAAYPDERVPRATDHLAFPPDLTGESRQMEREPATRGRLYGRVVADGGRLWLQYWFFLLDNPKHLMGFGRHQGDWEMVQIGLHAETHRPEVLTYAQHNAGEARAWEAAEHYEHDPERPLVYVANLSHASYFAAGTHPYLPGVDDTRGDGPVLCDLPVCPFGPWAAWEGRWGATRHRVKLRGASPPSPAHQGQKWKHPAAWHRRVSRRRPHELLGRVVHVIGTRTYPMPPHVSAGPPDAEGRVRVRWTRARHRGGRHIMLSLDDGEHVLASRVLVRPAHEDDALLRVPPGTVATTVRATSFNRLRQRSDPSTAEVPLPAWSA